jgi:hypothetical protein
MTNGEKCIYPVHILCFNRPDILEEFLSSLLSQTIEVDKNQVFFWLDHYSGSKDEQIGKTDQTIRTLACIQKYFPNSKIFSAAKNLGIARNYKRAEEFFYRSQQDSLFFEEDLVLSSDYLKAISDIDKALGGDPRVASISAHGITPIHNLDPRYRKSSREKAGWPLALSHRSWGYLLKINHAKERLHLLEIYFQALGSVPYSKRDANRISKTLAKHGLRVSGAAQDEVKAEIARKLGRMNITTNTQLARQIGIQGEHFIKTDQLVQPKIFNKIYGQWQGLKSISEYILKDMQAVYNRIIPYETLQVKINKPNLITRFRLLPKTGDAFDLYTYFNTHPLEENSHWGSYVWFKKYQIFRFPKGCSVLQLQIAEPLPSDRTVGQKIHSVGCRVKVYQDMLLIHKKGFGRGAILILPTFSPKMCDQKSDDVRHLACAAVSYKFRSS